MASSAARTDEGKLPQASSSLDAVSATAAKLLGPPADPLSFPRARFSRGKRTQVTCFLRGKYQVLNDVLMRDMTREFESEGEVRVTEAYWRISDKPKVNIAMGHIEVCALLEVREVEKKDRSDDELDDDYSDDIDGDCGLPVFVWKGTYVSVKVNYWDRMERFGNKYSDNPLTEVAALQLIGCHPSVVGIKDVLHDGRNLNVVMRYDCGGDLLELLSLCPEESPGLPEPDARNLFRQLVEGISHLHSVGICHRALCPESVTVNDEGCLVINLGKCLRVPYCVPNAIHISVVDIEVGTRRCLCRPQPPSGSLRYMSPELYRSREDFDTEAVDVWSAGAILFCMLTGQDSYHRPHPTDPLYLWMAQKRIPELFVHWNVDVSPEAVDLLSGMLDADPSQRISLQTALNHPWLAQ